MTSYDRRRPQTVDAKDVVGSIRNWQDRASDSCLTILLVLEVCAIFAAAPLAARGLPIARVISEALVIAVLVIVVMLSRRWAAITLIVLGLVATAASFWPLAERPQSWTSLLRRGGEIVAFLALIWVVAHAVYAPGRITSRRLQGAAVLYLSLGTTFAAAFGLIWELHPDAFANLVTPAGGPEEAGTMMYFSLTTLTTTGYGDIVPVDPLARSLANLEAVLGQFYLAITVARLVTLELQDRR